jgi:NADH-quinone oxidoreductase subunit L
VLAIGGIWLAYAMYVTGRISPKAMGARFHDLYVFFLNKWYIDELYHEVIVAPLAWLATVLWKWIDAGFIDGIVNGVGWLFGGVSQRLRRVQTGIVSNYALAIALGTVIIVGVYLIWGPQFLGR